MKKRFTEQELISLKEIADRTCTNELEKETFMNGINLMHDVRISLAKMSDKLMAVDPLNPATTLLAAVLLQVNYIFAAQDQSIPRSAMEALSVIAFEYFKTVASPGEMFEAMCNIPSDIAQ
jgi:hypothetical protein